MRLRISLLVVLAGLVAAPAAYACACCAEPGEWHQYVDRVDARDLANVRFRPLARLFLTAGGFDAVQGIAKPKARYPLSVVRSGRSWTLRFGSAGSLSFVLPARGEQYGVDLGDGKQSGGGGPLLYKELRLKGTARGTGAFTGGTFRLILMGRGNNCLNADDFHRWRLEVSGTGVRYALFGDLA
jgi:hypothetical protein